MPGPRRPPTPRPQTSRCRFVDDAGARCRSIATVQGFCHPHVRELEQRMTPARSPLDDLIGGLFGVRRMSARKLAEAGAELVSDQIRQRFPGIGLPPGTRPAAPGPAPAASSRPPPRVSPEAIQRRKAILAARGALGFEPDEALDQDKIRARRRELARLYHPDAAGQAKDPTREAMARKINEAADLLMQAAAPR